MYGARPLKRFISHEVETRIGRALLAGDIRDDATITLDDENNHLVVRWHHDDTALDDPADKVA